MASCLSGGTGRAYGFDIETIVKASSSSSTSSRLSNSSSPSSTLSESSNSLTTVSTRKPRTPRKRPNQTYNEAAALLSTACPSIFSLTKKHNKNSKLPNLHTYFFNEPPELLIPFREIERPIKVKPMEIEYNGSWNYSPNSNSLESSEGYQDDFDAESILDEEVEEGIDSIMGDPNSVQESDETCNKESSSSANFGLNHNCNTCYGYPMGLGFGGNLEFNFGFGFGLRNGVKALKNVNEGNWGFPVVNVMNISPPIKSKKTPVEKKKKVEDLMKMEPQVRKPVVGEEDLSLENGPKLSLKLNYDKVLKAWSDKASPLLEKRSTPESPEHDIHARLAKIDLFSENEGVREASVTRYKEKRRTWLFSKKIKYQVKKVSVDRRPRCKGRFVKRPTSPTCEDS